MYVIRERMFRMGEDSDITDQAGQPVLHVDGKVMSLHNRLILRDPAGREAGQVHRKLAALRPTYEITIDGKDVAEVRKHLFTRLFVEAPETRGLSHRHAQSGSLFEFLTDALRQLHQHVSHRTPAAGLRTRCRRPGGTDHAAPASAPARRSTR